MAGKWDQDTAGPRLDDDTVSDATLSDDTLSDDTDEEAAPSDFVINELLTNADAVSDDLGEWIELTNIGATALNDGPAPDYVSDPADLRLGNGTETTTTTPRIGAKATATTARTATRARRGSRTTGVRVRGARQRGARAAGRRRPRLRRGHGR